MYPQGTVGSNPTCSVMDETQQCNRCGIEKEIVAFSFRHKARNIRRRECKACFKPFTRKHYLRNKGLIYGRFVVHRRNIRQWVATLKNKPCTDCGIVYLPAVMEFDHLPEFTKIATISMMVADGCNRDKIKKEMAKCELVCANCHSVRTVTRRAAGIGG